MKTKTLKRDRVNIITLGCSKNMVDSEVLSGQLLANDIDTIHENEKLDHNIVIINTCGFIDKAKEESINTILDNVALKKKGKLDKVYVTGCLSERYRNNLEEEIPEVDAFFGTMELPQILKQFEADYKGELIGERLLATPSHYAYVKISEGCNRTCSFCAIPLMRGKHVSRTIESIVDEAKQLVKRGVKEIMLIAQELTYYGLDIYKKRELPRLLNELALVPGLEWIRLHYAYPSKFPMEILDAMNAHDNISAEEKEERAQEIMDVQQDISLEKNTEKIGQIFKVLVDKKESGRYMGRTEFDSVEVDNEVIINTKKKLVIGDFVQVKITKAFDYDLEGDLI